MKFMFHQQDRSPVETEGTFYDRQTQGRMPRPVPRIGETVYLDAEYFVVKNVIHHVQGEAVVRIFVERI